VASSGAVEKFELVDWLAVAVLFAVSLGIRVPFRSHFAYHWDSAQFALAIEHFNVSLSLPHRPGYFLFVMLGRMVNLFVGDPLTSLLWLNMVAGAGLAALGYLLGAALFERNCGWLTGGILATSPLCWFQSEVVFTTLVDSALVMTTVLVCWRAIRRGGSWPWVFAMAATLAVEAGIRQQTTPMLCPVWAYTFWRFPRLRWQKFAVGVVLTGLLCAAWFFPMVQPSGGTVAYLRLYPARINMDAPLTPWVGGFGVLIRNLAFIVATCWVGLLGAALLAATEFYSWATRAGNRRAAIKSRNEPLRFLAVWILPMVTFGIVVITVMPGYVLCYFPGVAILVALAITRFVERIARVLGCSRSFALGIVIAGIALINCAVFLLPAQRTEWLRAKLPLTASHIRDHDHQLAVWFDAIRKNFRPSDVLVCHYNQSYFYGFRQFEYHMPDYENCLLTTDHALPPPLNKKLWYATGRRVEFVDRFELHGRRQVILVVPPGLTIDAFTNAFDVMTARKWEIPDSLPLYVITPTTEWSASIRSGAN